MSREVVHPADLEASLEARVAARREESVAARRQPRGVQRRGRFLGMVVGSAALLTAGLVAAVAMATVSDSGTCDARVTADDERSLCTTSAGATVEYIGKNSEDFGSSGTGTFDSFVRVQEDGEEKGYNTDGTLQYNTKTGNWTHSIKVSAIPVVYLDPDAGGPATFGPYWELFNDLNETNTTAGRLISLNDIEVYFTTDNELTGYPFTGKATLEYEYHGDILINDVNSGSGRGDLRVRIPLTGITIPSNCSYGDSDCDTYFVLYNAWGQTDGYDSDATFEEFKVKQYPTLQIIKDTVGGDDTFDFTVTGPSTPLTPDPSITTTNGTGSSPLYIVDPGTYTIDEDGPPTGWTLTGSECSVNGAAATAYVPGSNIVIDDDPITNVVCTFTNARLPQMEVVKELVPATDSGTFDLKIDSTVYNNGGAGYGDGGSTGMQTVTVGSHTASEVGHTGTSLDDYDSSIECAINGDPAEETDTVDLDYGDTAVCTITNSRLPRMEVVKQLEPSTDDGLFDLKIDSTTYDNNGAGYGDGGSTGAHNVAVGLHTASEAAHTGTDLGDYSSSTSCSLNGGAPTSGGDVTLAYGDSAICTIVNTRQATLEVVKDLQPSTDTGRFDLLIDATVFDNAGVGYGDGGTTGAQVLAPGTYTASETAHSGTDVTDYAASTSCRVNGGTETAGGSVTLAAGDSAVCTIVNRRLPTIIVTKTTTGTAGGPFGFTTTGGHGFTTPFDLTTVTPGTAVSTSFTIDGEGIGEDYSVTEASMSAGFVLTDVSCAVTTAGEAGTTTGATLGTATGSITNLTAGTTVTCAFVNSGALTTRTQGFWSTHMWLVEEVWSPDGGTVGTLTHNGMTDAERTLCAGEDPLTVDEVMGGFWSNIAKETDGTKRSKLDQARMQLAQQLLAAILNNQLFGSAPSGVTIDQAKAAFCGTDVIAIKAAASAMAAFNESGDSGVFSPGGSADAKAARAAADKEYWDVLP